MNTYETIDLNDYVQTGEGETALTYNHKDGKTLAKLFMPSMTADNAIREFRISQIVYEIGLPTPKPIRLITDGEHYGAEYELIQHKRSFTRIISQEPDQLVLWGALPQPGACRQHLPFRQRHAAGSLGCLRKGVLRHRLLGSTGGRSQEAATLHRHEDSVIHQQTERREASLQRTAPANVRQILTTRE